MRERPRRLPHAGLVEVRAQLGLPELPQLDNVSRLLDGTTRARVWWRNPAQWRVAELTATGERDLAAVPGGVATWNYDDRSSTTVLGEPAIRLPRIDDLLPPQAARRILGAAGPDDRIEAICPLAGSPGSTPRACVSGRVTPRSRVARGRPVAAPRHRAAARRRGHRHPAEGAGAEHALPGLLRRDPRRRRSPLRSRRPAPGFRRPARPTSRRPSTDPARGSCPRPSPACPAPTRAARSGRVTGGAATYGTGLTRFVVLPLPGDVAREALQRARGLAPAARRGRRARRIRSNVRCSASWSPRADGETLRRAARVPSGRDGRRLAAARRRHRTVRQSATSPGAAAMTAPRAGAGPPTGPSRRRGSPRSTAAPRSSTASTSTCGWVTDTASSGRTARARRRRSGCCSGLVFATSGSISVLGQRIPRRTQSVLPEVGALVEGPAFYDHLSARTNLSLFDAAGKARQRARPPPAHLDRARAGRPGLGGP